MIRIGVRRYAVAEIEDQRPLAEDVQDAVGSMLLGRATGHDPHRIEIALNRPVLLQFGGEGERHRPVEADRIRTGRLPIILQQEARTLRESDDFGRGRRARTDAIIRRTGSIAKRWNSSSPSTPAQESNICTASAPASICCTR